LNFLVAPTLIGKTRVLRVYITGSSGSGTTTLAAGLSQKLMLAHEDSDDYFWEKTDPPFTTPRSVESMHQLFYSCVKQDRFVLSGDVLNWGLPDEQLLGSFTHVIYLYLPWTLREARIRQREKLRFGHRIQSGGDMFQLHEAFINWASRYETGELPGRNRTSQMSFLDRIRKSGCHVLELDSSLSPEDLLEQSLSFVRGM